MNSDGKQIRKSSVYTPTLEIAYEERGSAEGYPVILLHGFPDDIRAWDVVAERLSGCGYRVIVPYLRGFGPTRFLEPSTLRAGQQSAIANDVLDLMDALHIPEAALAGYDWGCRAACVASIIAPQRIRALVAIGGYNVHDLVSPIEPAPVAEEKALWYQWYFNTRRGYAGLTANRYDICLSLWQDWSPGFKFERSVYDITARSFNNPDFVDVVIHEYRHSHRNAEGDPRFEDMELMLSKQPQINVPTIVLHGDADAVHPTYCSERYMPLFPGGTKRYIVNSSGHFMPREKPLPVANALIEILNDTAAAG